MNKEKLDTVLANHLLWLSGQVGCRADLSRADLRGANLHRANGNFATGSFGRHDAIAAGGYISIGCERHAYQHWLEHGEDIGRNNGYAPVEIGRYMARIVLVVDWLTEAEKGAGE